MPYLQKFGEWRVIIANGEIISTVFTHPGETMGHFDWKPLNPHYTLQALKYAYPLFSSSKHIAHVMLDQLVLMTCSIMFTIQEMSTW
jgi:hypothetical protein